MECKYRIIRLGFILLWNHFMVFVNAQEFRESSGNLQTVSEASIPPDSRTVDLSYNKITRLYDGDFAALYQLQSLYLVSDEIAVIDYGAFRGLTSLQRLFLQSNKITDFPDLSELVQLTELYLQNNDISNLPDNVLLPADNNVQLLDLSYNKFTTVSNNFIRTFKALKYLNLCCGNLQMAPPVYEIANSLQILDLQSTRISTLASQSFTDGTSQSSLTELVLQNNRFTDVPDVFQNLPNLQVLNLNKMSLTELPNLTMNLNLRELHVSNNSLTSINFIGNPPDYSSRLALTIVNAAHNLIGSVDGAMLSSMTNLQRLNLGSNMLRTFPLESLVGATSLELINLESNQIKTLADWGVSSRNNLKIDISDNPLACDTMCWFGQSGYATYDADRLRDVTTSLACAEPQDMTSYTWQQITANPQLICVPEITPANTPANTPQNTPEPGDKTNGGDEEGSSNTLQIIIGIAVAVFVIAGIIAIVSVLKFCVWGKNQPDVILIGKMETGLSKKSKGKSFSNRNESSTDGDVKRKPKDNRHSRGRDKYSRHSKSPRNSRLQTISEKSENIENTEEGANKKSEEKKERNTDRKNDDSKRNGKQRSRKAPERSNTFNRDPTVSTEIPYQYTYRV